MKRISIAEYVKEQIEREQRSIKQVQTANKETEYLSKEEAWKIMHDGTIAIKLREMGLCDKFAKTMEKAVASHDKQE